MGRWAVFLVIATALGGAVPPARADALRAEPSPQDQTLQGMDMILQGLRRMLEQVPLYGPPEITSEGDIIIRRVPPGPMPGQPPVPPRPVFPPQSPGAPETRM